MKLSSFIVIKNFRLKHFVMLSGCVLLYGGNNVCADSLSYSPDQWPRHWNVLIRESQSQNFNGCCHPAAANYSDRDYRQMQEPARSPMWGMMPEIKQKNRRSLTPEYNTNFHRMNNLNQLTNYSTYYSSMHTPEINPYGFNSLYSTPYVSPYVLPGMAPGLAAPGLPFGVNPYLMNPYSGGYAPFGMAPGAGGLW